MWEAFHGRALAYEEALDAGDEAALAEALARNVWRGAPAPGASALARLALASAKALDRQSLAAFARGEADFPDPPSGLGGESAPSPPNHEPTQL